MKTKIIETERDLVERRSELVKVVTTRVVSIRLASKIFAMLKWKESKKRSVKRNIPS